jgi:hypothetical protein
MIHCQTLSIGISQPYGGKGRKERECGDRGRHRRKICRERVRSESPTHPPLLEWKPRPICQFPHQVGQTGRGLRLRLAARWSGNGGNGGNAAGTNDGA